MNKVIPRVTILNSFLITLKVIIVIKTIATAR